MNSVIRYFTLIIILAFNFHHTTAQCNDEETRKCLDKLKGYTFIKSIDVKFGHPKELLPANNTKYTYLFSKGKKYKITSCWEKDSPIDMTVRIFDKDGRMLASSFDEQNKQYTSSFSFECKKTGVYYFARTKT